MWTILFYFIFYYFFYVDHFKSIYLVTVLFLFYLFIFLVVSHVGILAPQPGLKPEPPKLEGKVLITGPPGKSHVFLVKIA